MSQLGIFLCLNQKLQLAAEALKRELTKSWRFYHFLLLKIKIDYDQVQC